MRDWQDQLRAARTRGGAAPWTPPTGAIHWYYGDALTAGAWSDRIGTLHAALVNGANVGADGLLCESAPQRYASLGTGVGLGIAGTVALWAKLSTFTANRFVFYHRTGTNPNRIGIYESGSVGQYASSAWRDLVNIGTIGTFVVDSWIHVAMAWDEGTVKTYFNGMPIATYTLDELNDYGGTVTLGSTHITPSEHTIDGNLDDVLLATVQYSDAQIADIYANSPGSHAS